MKKFYRSLLVGAACLSGSIATLPLSAEAASVRITGTLGLAAQGYKVLLVSSTGSAVVSTANAAGKFVISASKTAVKGATLQMVDTRNRYVGPVVLAKEALGKKTCAHMKLAGASVGLGTLRLSRLGYAITKSRPKASTFARQSIVARSTAGNPLAAGTGGIVKISSSQKRACAGSTVGTRGVQTFDADPLVLGADLDSDGLPNALDADDDGDQIIDAVDPTTTRTAALNPWVSLRTSSSLFNAGLNPTLSPSDIATVVGTPGNYAIQFFIGQRNFGVTGVNDVKYAWVDCGSLVYCGGTEPTAQNMLTHLSTSNTGVNWSTYNGGFKKETDNADATPGLDTSLGTSTNGNSLYLMNRNGRQDPESVYWVASLFPNQGENTLKTVKPGDVFTVRYNTSSGDNQIVMMVNPHAVTVPGLTKVNDVAYTGSALTPDSSGKLKLEFYRPQRLTTIGEEGKYRDMGGLRYGIIYMGNRDTACLSGAYSEYESGFSLQSGGDMATMLWPLTDTTTTDSATGTSSNQLKFTLDIRTCIGAETYDAATVGTQWNIQLTGAGQSLTGGSNRASLDLIVRK
jgi:hypothetical protein